MNEVIALIIGIALGGFFFIGLWWTVRKGLVATTPAIWFLVSFIVRITVALATFYWIASKGEWQHLVIALLGFVVARMLLTRFAPSPEVNKNAS